MSLESDGGNYRRYAEPLMHTLCLCGYAIMMFFGRGSAWDVIPPMVVAVIVAVPPVVFYGNVFWMLPRFLKGGSLGKYVAAAGIGLVSIVGIYAASIVVTGAFRDEGEGVFAILAGNGIRNVIFYNLLWISLAGSLAYWFVRDWFKSTRQIDRLKREKVEMELALLKSQVDPHFLFNSLNTLYALALEEGGERTADAVTKLSTMMRYALHDAQAEVISLGKEIDYLTRYIDLQKLRITENNLVSVDFGDTVHSSLKIAPMLLIFFVENAFKHGVRSSGDNRIDISASVEGMKLLFHVQNDKVSGPDDGESSGVGLGNVRKRLALYYPGRHALELDETEDRFVVNLTIELSL